MAGPDREEPDSDGIYQLLADLETACTCIDTICIHCRAAECIDELLIAAILNYYRSKQHTQRCHR